MKKAFTLLELVVVIVIIGILATLAFPSYQTAMERARQGEGLRILKLLFKGQQIYYSQYGDYSALTQYSGNINTKLGLDIPDTLKYFKTDGTMWIKTPGGGLDYIAKIARKNNPVCNYALVVFDNGEFNYEADVTGPEPGGLP